MECNRKVVLFTTLLALLGIVFVLYFKGNIQSTASNDHIYNFPSLDEILQDYTLLHKKILESPEPMKSKKLLVHVALGGLGNSMQGIVSSFLVALLTRRALLVSWTAMPEHNCTLNALFAQPFNWQIPNAMGMFTNHDTSLMLRFHNPLSVSDLFCKDLTDVYSDISTVSFTFERNFFTDVLGVFSDENYATLLLHGYHQADFVRMAGGTQKLGDLYGRVARFLFKPSPQVQVFSVPLM